MNGRVRWLLVVLCLLGCDKSDEKRDRERELLEGQAKSKAAAAAAARAAAARAKADAEAAASAPAAPPPLPASLDRVPVPADNPITDEKVELGRLLFFDKRLSADNSRACYSCHQNEQGTGGKEPLAIGARNQKLSRHSPVIWNAGFLPALYWDGRAQSLEEQATGAWSGANMGVGKEQLAQKAAEIGKIPAYAARFAKVFPGKGATPETVAAALATYERTLVCKDTAYDRHAKGDAKALNEQQEQGLELFRTKGGCMSCHAPPFFSISFVSRQGAYFNTGVGIEGKQEAEVDVGRMAVTKKASDWAAFKVPSLRNVSKSAPYFHDGSVAKLTDAVRFMARGGYKNKNLSPLMADKQLTGAEISAIVAFLKALDCEKKLEPPKKLP